MLRCLTAGRNSRDPPFNRFDKSLRGQINFRNDCKVSLVILPCDGTSDGGWGGQLLNPKLASLNLWRALKSNLDESWTKDSFFFLKKVLVVFNKQAGSAEWYIVLCDKGIYCNNHRVRYKCFASFI